jgi:hypothetical protein
MKKKVSRKLEIKRTTVLNLNPAQYLGQVHGGSTDTLCETDDFSCIHSVAGYGCGA